MHNYNIRECKNIQNPRKVSLRVITTPTTKYLVVVLALEWGKSESVGLLVRVDGEVA